MALQPQALSGQELVWLNASVPLGTLGSATRILFQDGLTILVPELHIVRRCIIASNNVVGGPTVQLVQWLTSGDEATPVAVSDIVAATNSAGGADVILQELTFPAGVKSYVSAPAIYSLRLVGNDAGDLYDDPCLLLGVEMLERR